MYHHYDNPKIYKNLRAAKGWTIASCVLAVLTLFTYVLLYEILKFPFSVEEYGEEPSLGKQFFYFPVVLLLLCAPMIFRYIRPSATPGNKALNDCDNCPLTVLGLCLIPWAWFLFMWIIFGIIAATSHGDGLDTIRSMAGHLGYTLLAQIPLYIATGILLRTRKLIKQEWEKAPPPFYAEELLKQEQERQEQKSAQDSQLYHSLIEQCGARFFIKYYRQIVRLPLRDVVVSENYSSAEREERLLAAKKLIDSGLIELTLTEILKDYGDALESSEAEQAKALLAELQATHSEENAANEFPREKEETPPAP